MIEDVSSRQTDLTTKVARLNGGSIKFYSGVRPAALTTSGNTLLSTCPLSVTAATVSLGVATFNPITADAAPVANGTISFAFLCKADGTPLYNLSVGLTGSGADVIVDVINVTTTGSVTVVSLVFTYPAGT